MKNAGKKMIKELVNCYSALAVCENEVTAAAEMLVDCYKNGSQGLSPKNKKSAPADFFADVN